MLIIWKEQLGKCQKLLNKELVLNWRVKQNRLNTKKRSQKGWKDIGQPYQPHQMRIWITGYNDFFCCINYYQIGKMYATVDKKIIKNKQQWSDN